MRAILVPLTKIMARAERDGLIASSPMRKLETSDRPASSNGERRSLTDDERNRLLAAAICKSGIGFAKATDADIAAIEQAEQPVYDQLQNDPLTGRVVTQIQALKKQFPGSATVSVPAACKG